MKLEFLPKVITLLAGAIVCIITIVNEMDTVYSLELVLATLIIFYIVGQIAKAIIQKVIGGNMFVKRHDGSGRNIKIPETKKEDQSGNTAAAADVGGNNE